MKPCPLSCLLFLSCLAAFPSAAAPRLPETIPVDEVRPGMKGYGLTAFQGSRPERFAVEVVSVVPNFLLRQSIILIRCAHPVTDRAGVIGGMSGSPIYLEDRLAGALAYGWRFNKEPLAGVTPIADMLAVARRPPPPAAPLARLFDPRAPFARTAADSLAALHRGHAALVPSASGDTGLVTARTPLSLGGFVADAARLFGELFAPLGLDPVQGGGGGAVPAGAPTTFEPGAPLGVQLIRGDMNATGIGTVTAVDGSTVLAFGHPMMGLGQARLPVTTATIHTVIASLERSSKLGTPLAVAGSLVQDRQAAIVARADELAPTIPVRIRLEDPRGLRAETYHAEIASQRLLTPLLLQVLVANVVHAAASDPADVTVRVSGSVRLVGRSAPVELVDAGVSRRGLGALTGWLRPVAIVGALLDNPFAEVAVERVDLDLRLAYGLALETIVGGELSAERPRPGQAVEVAVRLRAFDGPERTVRVPVVIPESAAGQEILVELGGGDFVTPVLPEPQSLDDLVANAARQHPADALVVSLLVPGEGLAVRGRLLERLPPSAVDALLPAAGFDQAATFRTALRHVLPQGRIVVGRETFRVTVDARRSR